MQLYSTGSAMLVLLFLIMMLLCVLCWMCTGHYQDRPGTQSTDRSLVKRHTTGATAWGAHGCTVHLPCCPCVWRRAGAPLPGVCVWVGACGGVVSLPGTGTLCISNHCSAAAAGGRRWLAASGHKLRLTQPSRLGKAGGFSVSEKRMCSAPPAGQGNLHRLCCACSLHHERIHCPPSPPQRRPGSLTVQCYKNGVQCGYRTYFVAVAALFRVQLLP